MFFTETYYCIAQNKHLIHKIHTSGIILKVKYSYNYFIKFYLIIIIIKSLLLLIISVSYRHSKYYHY